MATLEDRFRHVARGLLAEGGRVLAAVSGGADSVALLRLLHAGSDPLRLALVVGHVNHAMREEAAEDERFVRDLAVRLGLPCLVRRAVPPPRNEEQARLVRHRLLREMAREAGCTRIALAHTMDDQAETVLMRLVRGAGRRGLSGMKAEGPGPLRRPLLGMRRADLRSWLAQRNQPFREDASNRDQRRLRNKVRARLIPLLEEMNPAVIAALARAAGVLASEDAWLDRAAASWLTTHARPAPSSGPGAVAVVRTGLASLDTAMARRVARLLLKGAGADPRGLPLAAVDRLVDLAHGTRASRIDLPGGMQASRERFDLVVHRAQAAQAAGRPWEVRLSVPGRTDLPGSDLVLTARLVSAESAHGVPAGARRAILDADQLGGLLTVRTRLPGDVFHPLGAPGPKKLGRFLIDRRVPLSRRGSLVLVVGRNGIAWVAGVEIGHDDRVTPGTQRVAILELAGGEPEVDPAPADV